MFSKDQNFRVARFALLLVLLGGLFGIVSARADASVYRVALGGASSPSCGSSWSNPCDLQYALTTLATIGDELWVQEGLYKPGIDWTSTFVLKDGVALYGGFAGTEASRDQRDPSAYITILSGDLNGDDNNNIAPDEPTRAENVLHVVSCSNAGGATVLDGFTITGGNANLDYPNYTSRGGGMINVNSSPTLTNLIFTLNSAAAVGGGVENVDHSNPHMTNVEFINNSAEGGGGLDNYASSPVLVNVIFDHNLATYFGGGVFSGANTTPTFTDVTFSNNTSGNYGGGMGNVGNSPNISSTTFYNNHAVEGGGIYNRAATPTLTNTTITNNSADNGGSGIGNEASHITIMHATIANNYDGIKNDTASGSAIRNSIIWGNVYPPTGAVTSIFGYAEVSDSVVQDGFPEGTHIITTDPALGPLGDYGGSTQTIPLSPGSSAIDQGNESYCPAADQRNISRPQGSGCDIGAYEYQTRTLAPGETIRVSVSSSGGQANGASYAPSISADGRYVAFNSDTANLVPDDTNGLEDVFVYDTQTSLTRRVSVDSSGGQGDGYSYYPSVSEDGRYVAFHSSATNLVPDDTNGVYDIFVYDLQTGLTRRISVDSYGTQANDRSSGATLSADGRYVAFVSSATNLVPGDTNGEDDVFIHDMLTGATTRVSVDSNGAQANSFSFTPSISVDGRYVAFQSSATNLVPGDTNGAYDIFARDMQTGMTTRVSVDASGIQGNGASSYPSISGDGRYIVFGSIATNLVPDDTNEVGDIFVYELQTGVTTRVSVDSNGMQGNGQSVSGPSKAISEDGRYVAFQSEATNLVPGDTNHVDDIFVRDMQAGMTTRVSVDSNGGQGNDFSNGSYISADGGYIAFFSAATNLVAGDTNLQWDIFVHRQAILPIPPTSTPTFTPTSTATATPTGTSTNTAMATTTYTATATPTITVTPTRTPRQIRSPVPTRTRLPTRTPIPRKMPRRLIGR
ncbi:MAG TPA: choice-of-anchor Q domain-containing protein [Anaerolineales bacterium]|nr:choice-of-anchor Q domain-containing protein [Anaerolineales bacterium]